MNLDPSLVFWLVVLVQVVGFASMVAARLSERMAAQRAFHAIFFACLVFMAIASVGALALGSNYGFSLAVAVSLMTLGATLDLRRSPQLAA